MQNSELTDEHGVGHQQERWASNGKSFNLDELPGELMRHVFFEALQPRSALDLLGISPAFDNPNGGKDPRYMFGTGIFVDDMPANRELLLVSKEVQETAFEIVWIYSRQVFQTSADFVRFYRVHNQLSYVTLNKVCFAFAMEDWAQVMGIPISNNVQRFNFDPANPNRDHTLMQLLRQLQDLQIYFRSSKHTSPPPPVRTVAATEDREAEEEEAKEPRDYPADALLTVMPYQRVICNAILVYAWPWIKDVGKIRLSGCIKDSTKALWLERHLVYRFQGVEPDLREDEKIIQDICEREEYPT